MLENLLSDLDSLGVQDEIPNFSFYSEGGHEYSLESEEYKIAQDWNSNSYMKIIEVNIKMNSYGIVLPDNRNMLTSAIRRTYLKEGSKIVFNKGVKIEIGSPIGNNHSMTLYRKGVIVSAINISKEILYCPKDSKELVLQKILPFINAF